jgi:uncharacterized coiled-coil DUF342 family protein
MTNSTQVTQALHPGVVALDEKIRILASSLRILETREFSQEEEDKVVAQIAALQERLSMMRRHRAEAGPTISKRHEELAGLRKLRETCVADPRISEAVWMQLLLQRKPR